MDEEIRSVVRDYLDGMMFADEARLRRAFHPAAKSIGHDRAGLEWDSIDTFVGACKAAGALPAGSSYYWKILFLEITGDMAIVTLEDDYQGARYTDYLTLMLLDGRWQIINKAFYRHG